MPYQGNKWVNLPGKLINCSTGKDGALWGVTFSFADRKGVEELNALYDIKTIPSLVVLAPDGTVVTKAGRNMVVSDPTASDFPWAGAKDNAQAAPTISRFQIMMMLVVVLVLLFADMFSRD